MGLGIMPKTFDQTAAKLDLRVLHGHFAGLRDQIAATVQAMPSHNLFIDKQVAAPPVPGVAV